MISRREPYLTGGFDYFAYLEDVDFGWRSGSYDIALSSRARPCAMRRARQRAMEIPERGVPSATRCRPCSELRGRSLRDVAASVSTPICIDCITTRRRAIAAQRSSVASRFRTAPLRNGFWSRVRRFECREAARDD